MGANEANRGEEMFKIRIECEQKEWISYVHAQQIENEDEFFLFSNPEKATEILSRYLMFMIKTMELQKIMDKKWITEEQGNDLLIHAPNTLLMEAYQLIFDSVQRYIQEHEGIHVEGFISFRLKNASGRMETAIQKAYESYCDIDLGDSVQLKEIMQSQRSAEKDMFLILSEQSKMTLRGASHIYFEAHVDDDDYDTEDNIISHLILASPVKLHVFDPHDRLSKSIVVILRQLFEEKVIFYREEYAQDTH